MADKIIGNPDAMFAFSQSATLVAEAYITALMQTSAAMQPPTIQPNFPTIPSPPTPITKPLPDFQPITWSVPNPPAPFVGSLDISGLLPAPFDGTPPSLLFPSAPAGFSEAAPDSPSVQLSFDYPTLALNLPAPPNLLQLTVTPFSGMNLPTAPGDPSELTAVAPNPIPYVPGAEYVSLLLTQVKSTLQERLTGLKTGLPAEVETALWDRAREREARSVAEKRAALDQMEALGYSLPPGAFVDARLKIDTEAMANEAGASREIMIKAAELQLENINRATDSAIQLESTLVQYANQIEQRNFEASKYATEAGIAIYNAKVQAYAAYLDAYKTKAAIYEAQIRAEVSKVDAYRAQVEAERAKAEINKALVDQYDTMARVALSSIEVYKAELGAIQTKAEIEKTKVQVFGEQVRAYLGKINAYTANIEAYKATVQAEGTKQEAFRSQVQAYTARVEAAVKSAEALIEEYKGKISAKTAEYDGYKAIVQAESAKAQAMATINQTLADAYKAEIGAISAYNELLTKQWQVALDEAERIAEVGIQSAKMNAELYITTRQLAAEGAKVGAQVNAQLAAAALNAIHWSSSVSTSEGHNVSESSGVSTSTNYNYNSSV